MPEIDDALESLGHFPEHPPVPATPVGAIARRARRSRRNRRLAQSVLASIVALVGVTVGASVVTSDDDNKVEVTNTTVEQPTTTTAPPALSRDATAVPDTELEDGSVVTVEFARTPQPGLAAQCAFEAVAEGTDQGWCDINVARDASTTDPNVVTFTVSRVIETGNGLVDCAERPRRCVLGAYPQGAAMDHAMYTAISFRDDLPALPSPALTVSRTSVADGTVLQVTGAELPPETDVFVSQCTGPGYENCDIARSRRVVTDADGAFTIEFVASHEIQTYEGWHECEPCELRATAFRAAPASVELDVAAGSQPRRPRVEIVPAGPYSAGQRVTLEGYDFQIGGGFQIGWCQLKGDEYPGCAYPTEGFGIAVEADGRFTRPDYPMPDPAFGLGHTCVPPAQCVLAWHPGEGSPAAFETPFTMLP